MSTIVVEHQPCHKCNSSDALAVYDNKEYGHTWKCFSCGEHGRIKDLEEFLADLGNNVQQATVGAQVDNTQGLKWGFAGIPDRKISKDTAKHYNIKVGVDDTGSIKQHMYPHYDTAGNVVYTKYRTCATKEFRMSGSPKDAPLFGQNLFAPSDRVTLTITEGQLDAPSGYQALGSKYPWVSVSSASSAAADIKANWEYVTGFKDVVVMFDNDEAGRKAALEVIQLLPHGYAKMFKHSQGLKDASDYLQQGQVGKLKDGWFEAAPITPSGITVSNDASFKEKLKNFKYVEGVPYPWDSWNKKLYGIRKGEFVLLAARRGAGKTTGAREIVYSILQNTPIDEKVGTFFLEETEERTGLGMLSLAANKPMHMPDSVYTDAEWNEAYDIVLKDGRLIMYDKGGVIELSKLRATLEYFSKVHNVGYIILDHCLRVYDKSQNDERRALDNLSKTLTSVAKELNMGVLGIIHLNRDGFVRGADGPENEASVVIHMTKGIDEVTGDRLTEVEITKNRLYGHEGPCPPLKIDKVTGRMYEDTDYQSEDDMLGELDTYAKSKG